MLSLICSYNNRELLEDTLLKSLKEQSYTNYEIILIDSKAKGFLSASSALNYGAEKAKGNYLIFIHQDVYFTDKDILSKIDYFCAHNEFGIMGVAGVSLENNNRQFYSNVVHGSEKKPSGAKFESVKETVSLDECLLVIPARVFNDYKFTDFGNTWHLYGTDYCLKMKQNSLKAYIAPLNLWHLSSGASLNECYFDTIKKLCRTYNENEIIYTAFGTWPTKMIYLTLKCAWRKFRLKFIE